MAKITIEQISNTLAPVNWKCLSTDADYKNMDSVLTFQCPFQHKVFTTWRKLRNTQFCPICDSNENNKQGLANIAATKRKKDVRRILVVDQSTRVSGYAIYDDTELISYGLYNCTKMEPLDRIVDICDWLISMITNWKPDFVGFEDTQYQVQGGTGHNVFKLLSQLLGAAMVTAAREHVEVDTVQASVWRGHCGVKGKKRADQKKSAQLLVRKWYNMDVTNDESDAICIGKYFSDRYKQQDEVIIGEWI